MAKKRSTKVVPVESEDALKAAQAGWGTTVRFGLLRILQPIPLAATGSATILSKGLVAYARAQGWM